MAGTKFKWKLGVFLYLILVNVFTKSLPIEVKLPSLITTDTVFRNAEIPDNILTTTDLVEDQITSTEKQDISSFENSTEVIEDNPIDEILNETRSTSPQRLLQSLRPSQSIQTYAIEISPAENNDRFRGRAVINVEIMREESIMLYVEGLVIESVLAGLFNTANALPADFSIDDDGFLEIEPSQVGSTFVLIITYTGSLASAGQGLYRGGYNDLDYIAMNLHPTNARRVFPCMDEPTITSIISFTFNGFDYPNFVSNTIQEDNNLIQFKPMEGPSHLWSVVGHSFSSIISPTTNVVLNVRQGTSQQDLSYASLVINNVFEYLLRWTENSYFEIHTNQNPQFQIFAFPDVSVDWYGLTITGVWEPYVVMANAGSVKQRCIGFEKIAEAIAKQWFGYVIYPQNWQYEWVVSGLASYAGWEALREFQNEAVTTDLTMVDINTLFVTEIIQEALYRDSYTDILPLEPGRDIFFDEDVRDVVYGILKYKAPAILRMLRLTLGQGDQDFIQTAAKSLVAGRAFQTVNSERFEDAVNSEWMANGNNIVDEFEDLLRPWIQNTGYPLVHVGLTSRGVQLTQRRFSYRSMSESSFIVPITFSESIQPNFDTINPFDRRSMLEAIMNLDINMDEEEGDYVLINNQGQGYYRVNYDDELWERIIEALEDPDMRQQIHPLNRATLIDDALNIARSSNLDYDIAFRVVLSMEHETEYAPWRAFIRNMDFLRKRLVAMVEDDDDLDPDIYLRMVRRTINAFEREIGFTPDMNIAEQAMVSLTRGIVMDHACRANYQPCIAAAIDWFWNPNNNEVVNPDIPADIKPAVYCTSVREGGANVISALTARLEIETYMYDRLVILESLACSTDASFINGYLASTLGTDSEYTPAEGLAIFKAVAAASTNNALLAFNFVSTRPNAIIARYGGNEKLEEAIYALGQNLGDYGHAQDFVIWVNNQNNGLGDSNDSANRTANMVLEDMNWQDVYLNDVYDWIDENDAATLFVSSILMLISVAIAVYNH